MMQTRTDALGLWAGGALLVGGNVASWLAAPRWLSLSAVVAGAVLMCAAAASRVVTATRADEGERRFYVPFAGGWAGVALAVLALQGLGRRYDVVSLCLIAASGGVGAFLAWNLMRR